MSSVREEWSLSCPVCGSDSHLQVEFKCMARLTPDGTDAIDDHHDWDDTSLMTCSACGRVATVAQFKVSEPARAPSPLKAIIADIARTELGLETLHARNSDELDFHEHAVWSIERALTAAFMAGSALQSELIDALKLALHALNTARRFRVADTDSYAIASRVDDVLEKAGAR